MAFCSRINFGRTDSYFFEIGRETWGYPPKQTGPKPLPDAPESEDAQYLGYAWPQGQTAIGKGQYQLFEPDPIPATDRTPDLRVRFGGPFLKKNPKFSKNNCHGQCVHLTKKSFLQKKEGIVKHLLKLFTLGHVSFLARSTDLNF